MARVFERWVLWGSMVALVLRNKTVLQFHRLTKRLHYCYRLRKGTRESFQLLVHPVIQLHRMVQTLTATQTHSEQVTITLLLHHSQYYHEQEHQNG